MVYTEDNILDIQNPPRRDGKYPVAGIYFLLLNSEIIYVGKSINCYERIRVHRGSKNFDDFKILKINRNEIDFMPILERHFITKFNPVLNKTFPIRKKSKK